MDYNTKFRLNLNESLSMCLNYLHKRGWISPHHKKITVIHIVKIIVSNEN